MQRRILWVGKLIGLGLSLSFATTMGYVLRAYVVDDAYITFRHARNLVNGAGFTFNPGDHLLSTTAPLHGLMLATLAVVFRLNQYTAAAITISTVSMLVLCLVTVVTMSQNKAAVAGIAGVVLVSSQHWLYRFFPLETILVLALNVASIALAMNRRWIWSGVLSGLAMIARPDSVVLVGIMAVYAWWDARRLLPGRGPTTYLLSAVAIASLWYGFAWAYYGTPLPNTLAAKSGYGWFVYAAALWPKILSALLLNHVLLSALIVLLAIIGSAWALIERSKLMLFPAWAAAHVLGYTALRIAFPYAWYYAPIVFVTLIMACYGAQRTAALLQAGLQNRLSGPAGQFAMRFGWACLAAGFALVWWLSLTSSLAFAQSYGTDHFSGARDTTYRLVSDWLRLNTASTDRVAIGEIGTVGWYSDRYIVDFYGLATYALRDLPKTENWPGAIEQIQPEYVVSVRNAAPDPQMKGLALPNYVEVMRLPEDGMTNSYEDVVVYRRLNQ